MANSVTKPQMGQIENWKRWKMPGCEGYGLGYVIVGTLVGGRPGGLQTSYVVSDQDGVIETRNSRYSLIGSENTNISPL